MKKALLFLIFTCASILAFGQNPGDTIRVKSFTFDNPSRDLMASFPDDPNLTFEKVLLKYTMRCKDALVSTGASPDLGCGQWDFSNNTYLVDSTKIWEDPRTVPSHLITNFSGNEFIFSETPVYDFERSVSTIAAASQDFENTAVVGTGTSEINRAIATNNIAGRSYFLYTAEQLQAAGATAGEIEGIELDVLSNTSQAGFLRLNMKQTTKQELNGEVETEGFQEVYYSNTEFAAIGKKPLVFGTPFTWDGTSNILVEFSFTNLVITDFSSTVLQGSTTDDLMGMTAINEQEILLTNNTYIECNDYKGIAGSQNRTIEAWIRTDQNSPIGDIIAWGNTATSEKFTFRFQNGRIRLEVSNGSTEGTTRLDDGVWHHVAMVFNGSNLSGVQFYIDGNLDPKATTSSVAVNTAVNTNNVRVSRGVNNRYIDGSIDDVRIWDEALSGETIRNWKSLKIDETHPNYENLQLNFEFSESGEDVIDSSVNGRNGKIIGNEIRLTQSNGASLFKDFIIQNERPNLTFLQANGGVISAEQIVLDRPVVKAPRHFVATRSIESTDASLPFDDIINVSKPIEYWTLDSKIYDEATGEIIEETLASQDGVINITDLEYKRRFPFYNELISFVTPYGINLDLGSQGASWYMDMTDYMPILKGDKRLVMTLGGQNQEEMDLEFLFIVGTPPRDVIQFDQIWQGTNLLGNATIAQLAADEKHAPTDVHMSADASAFKLRSSITGHGSEGEFGQNGGVISHRISTTEGFLFEWGITQECAFNPIFPQGGTWVFDRQGWCPGEQSLVKEHDLTSIVTPGEPFTLDYSTSAAPNPAGDYRYHIAHQVIGYGEPNFQLDASVIEIAAPNNTAEYRRVGEICANPMVTIRNTGATELTSLIINYWINDAQTPQTYEWSGSLDFMESETVTIPSTRDLWFDLLDENNRFHVSIDSPNGGGDEYGFNNTMTSNFDFPEVLPSKFTIEFRTNNSSSENSYELVDAAGNILGSNPLAANNTFVNDDYELGDDCYTLIVRDTGGDGLQWFANPGQGTGTARIKAENGAILKTFEPDFGGGFEFRFTTDFVVSVQELEFIKSIEVFPNPASEMVTIEADDMNETNVFMTDLLGRNVSASILNKTDDSISFDVQLLNAGVYFIVLKKDDIRTTRKLIIE